jgi:hypothetical protein
MRDLHEARSAFDSVGQTGFLSQVDITEMASSANSVGNTLNAKNLVVKTAGDWVITGGEINTETSAVEVGGDMTVAAGKDLAFHEKTVKTVQLVIGGGIGAGGYEANAMWGSAANIDTQLASPFDGQGDETSSVRSHASAGRSASSQALATEGTGGRTGANKGRGATSGANVKIGLEMVTTTDTTESRTHRNAQLNLGSGSVDVGGTFDFGGADINAGFQLSPEERAKMTAQERIAATEAMPTLDIKAGDIKTTKYESTEKTSHSREELFFGFTAEAHSSLADVATQVANTAHKAMGTDAVNDPNAPAGSSKTQAMSEGKMEIDPALTAVAAAGLATQVAFGEVIGASRTLGMQHTKENRESESRAENINQVGGNISLTSTQGDIALNGVNLQGGKVAIKSAGALTQQAAKSSSSSSESVTTHRVGISDSIGVSPTGAGMGISVGADGSYDETKTRSTSYQNGLISGTEVSIETAGDHTMIGSNIKGNQVSAKIGGDQTITSVQDTSTMDHTRGNWSASVGIAITTNGLIQGTGSFSASGGKDFDNSKLVAEQAGISADSLSLDVAKNLNLTGAHITSKQGSVDVGGKITAQTLHDSREKDGGYGGGGAGISKNGLPSATFEFGRVDQVKYHADNAATIDVGDSSNVKAAGGISGKLNTDASKQLNVTQNKRVAGTDVKIEVSISDAQEIKDGVKKLVTPKAGGTNRPQSRPTSQPKPAFDQRVIVNTDTRDPAVNKAVQNLTNKHPNNSVVITPSAAGGHTILHGALVTGGSTKVEVVGHGRNSDNLGGLSGKQITDLVGKLSADNRLQIDKLTLVGCGTNCSKDAPSLTDQVRGLLNQQSAVIAVKGYDTAIEVSDQGHKRTALDGAPLALGKDDVPKQDAANAQATSKPQEDSVIWQGERLGFVDAKAAAYLQHVKEKATEQLQSGPVLLGEAHTLPTTSLLVEQLIKEGSVNRVVFELPPLELMTVWLGLDSLSLTADTRDKVAEHLSEFDGDTQQDAFHEFAKTTVSTVMEKVFDKTIKANLVDHVIASGVNVDFIDGLRKLDGGYINLPVRNEYMASVMKAQDKYLAPGTLGVFGAEHLRRYIGADGGLYPPLQSLLDVDPARVFDISPLFIDRETGQHHYPAADSGEKRLEISRIHPYKVNEEGTYAAVKYNRRVVVNGAGDTANPSIEQIRKKHPSSTVVFDVTADGQLNYRAGTAYSGAGAKSKVYIFDGSNKTSVDSAQLVKGVASKMGDYVENFDVKAYYVGNGEFRQQAPEKYEKYIIVNADKGNPDVEQAVSRLVEKHPDRSVVVARTATANPEVLSGSLKHVGGTAKYEVVGHGHDGRLGSMSPEHIADLIPKLSVATGTAVEKLTLVGCETACGDASFVDEVKFLLATQGIADTSVKGYQTPIVVDEQGHKQPVTLGTPGALGKDDPAELNKTDDADAGASKPPDNELSLPQDVATPSIIWKAQGAGIITYETAEYLEHIKNKAIEQLKTGPVLFGENHHLPNSTLVLKQLINEGASRHVLIEQPPLREQLPYAQEEVPRVILKIKGYSSLDDYFDRFPEREMSTVFYKSAREKVVNGFKVLTNDYMGKLVAEVASSDVHFRLVDGGRVPGTQHADDRSEFAARNAYMADVINSDPAYKLPGVVGVFGEEHLRMQLGVNDTQEPALQQLVNIEQNRVLPLTPLNYDYETELEYFPWGALGTKSSSVSMSNDRPYKYVGQVDPVSDSAGRPGLLRKNGSHVVINAAGESARGRIEEIKEQHPSSTIEFTGLADGGVDYVDGVAFNYEEMRTKAFVFLAGDNLGADTDTWLASAANHLNRDPESMSVKEFYRSRHGDFKPGPKPMYEQHIIVNANEGDPAAEQAVQHLANKHPDNSVVISAADDGSLSLLSGEVDTTGALTKVEIVGHSAPESERAALGNFDTEDIIELIEQLSRQHDTRVDQLSLVGCGTSCAGAGLSLAGQVTEQLQQLGLPTRVKGYDTPVTVDPQGHKNATSADAVDALGKDDPPEEGAVGGAQGSAASEPAFVPNLIWQAEQRGAIDYSTAEYLEHVKNKAAYLLQLGPVFFGETHHEPHADLMVQQLLAENRLRRIIVEEEPIDASYDLARRQEINPVMGRKGFTSLDDYFSNADSIERTTLYYQAVRTLLAKEAEGRFVHQNHGSLLATVINSGQRFDFVDTGRSYEHEFADEVEKFTFRNAVMAEVLNGSPKYSLPGVIGIFGADHLATYPMVDGLKESGLQDRVNIPQHRVFPLSPLFEDFETGERYYSWSALGSERSAEAPMSETWPYKAVEQPGAVPPVSFVLRANKGHVILNAVGDRAKGEIEHVSETHPSSTIVFDALPGGRLEYVDGAGTNYGAQRPTKVFLFTDDNSEQDDKLDWLSLAGLKLNKDVDFFKIKEFSFSPAAEPVSPPATAPAVEDGAAGASPAAARP